MEGIRSGDPQALADLYDQHAATLLALCRRLLRDPAEAEDVLEEIFFEVWRRADRYDPGRGSPAVSSG